MPDAYSADRGNPTAPKSSYKLLFDAYYLKLMSAGARCCRHGMLALESPSHECSTTRGPVKPWRGTVPFRQANTGFDLIRCPPNQALWTGIFAMIGPRQAGA